MNIIPPETIVRYQPNGDIYTKLVDQYGTSNADFISSAAMTGDRAKLTEAIATVSNGEALNENTSLIFIGQLLTDPLAAPADMVSKAYEKLTSPVGLAITFGLVALVIIVIAAPKAAGR